MRKSLLIGFLCLLHVSVVWAQERTVTGKVTGAEDGSTLPGVNVLLKGTTNGTTTDVNGVYTLTIPATGGTLTFSFIGLITQEIEVGQRSVIDVAMNQDMTQLSEVVVTALGVERSQAALGYSASTVSSKEVSQGRSFSPINALQGKVAGVIVNSSSGQPGAATFVTIRGVNSIGGNNNPLYVIDGVPINNGFNNFTSDNNNANRQQDFGNRANDINPDDIESVTVLKSASATALYGSRAANGVIVITTKKGKTGDRLRVNVSSSATFSTPLRLPEVQQEFGQGWNGINDLTQNGSWGPKFDGRTRIWGNVVDNSQLIKPYVALEDNIRDFYDVGTAFMNTVSVSGGTDKLTYYFSYGNTSEDGIIPTDADSYKRNTFSFRGSYTGKKLSVSSSINYFLKNAKAVTVGQGANGATLFQEMIQIPNDLSVVDMKDYNNKFYNLDNFYTPYNQNPWFVLKENGNDFVENRIQGNLNFDYHFTDWFSAKWRIGTDVANSQVKDWIAIATFNNEGYNASEIDVPGTVFNRSRYSREVNSDLILSFNKKISSDLNFDGFVGHNVNQRGQDDYDAYASNLSVPRFYVLANSANPPTIITNTTLRRLVGVYAQASLSYKDYLYFSASARNDWSSTLPKGNNSYFYGGANASLVFSDAFASLGGGPLSFGKVRVAVGQTGRDADPYGVYNVFVPSTVQLSFGELRFPLKGINAFEVSNQLGNPNLKPEITTEVEVGTELKFFQNRLGIDLTLYNKNTKDQILPVQVANSTGYTTYFNNLGKVQNKGLELLVSVTPVEIGDFSWTVTSNWTFNRNKVIALADGLDEFLINSIYGIDFVAAKGRPVGAYKAVDYARDPNGHIIVNAQGIPTASAEKGFIGNMQPDFVTGLSNQFIYKGLSLAFTFDYRRGGDMYSYTKRLMEFVGNSTNTLYNDRKPFIVPNSVKQVGTDDAPVYVENDIPVNVNNFSEYMNSSTNLYQERGHVLDRTFVKLREVVLSYNLPSSLLQSTPITSLNVSLVGRNLFLWTPSSNNIVDPEITGYNGSQVSAFSGEFAVGPTVRSYGISLKAGF
ncbi:SusC/RagA family TonB-linked outer membrane protein [Dawidia soli]|uniref:SusC/RagA family TonB-linked outer membrane protein n=1 Tax=Dawidia soli TaxID=2782352 RepID=A0AAP2D835_9BACT|nr:SusC/RagA family TonB-linked outer membrane protein [Dawidia soli]MBT1685770.1 SusC/RagA family TonB-linked outer membrane protein [Dawidia soli]